MVKAKFKPQKDITAYELAYIFGQIGHGMFSPGPSIRAVKFKGDDWEGLDPAIRRHFEVGD